MSLIPEKLADLLTRPIPVVITTVMPNGQPQSTPVWFSYDGDQVWINTVVGRQKDKNLQRNPKVSLVVVDPQDQLHWIEIRGEVTERILEGAAAHIDQLSRHYVNKPFYGGFAAAERATTETRVIYKIKPVKVNPK